jgi:hypothetical protein
MFEGFSGLFRGEIDDIRYCPESFDRDLRIDAVGIDAVSIDAIDLNDAVGAGAVSVRLRNIEIFFGSRG